MEALWLAVSREKKGTNKKQNNRTDYFSPRANRTKTGNTECAFYQHPLK